MNATTLPYLTHLNTGHHNCGANYGWCGEHASYRADYECVCGRTVVVEQCAAWPVTQTECPRCFRTVECVMPQTAVTESLR